MPEDARVTEGVRLINDAEELVRDERAAAGGAGTGAALRASEGLLCAPPFPRPRASSSATPTPPSPIHDRP